MKKISQIGIIILIISIVVGFSINYIFYEPTEINAFVTSKMYKDGVANPAFEDENFYKCVVDSYNEENGTSHPYTYNLSDEELKTITSISCYGKKLFSAKGLEKLVSLTTLNLNLNQLISLDVSKNSNLTKLDVKNNQLTNLDVSSNSALTYLNVEDNQLTELEVSNNPALTSLTVWYNRLTSLDVSSNTALTSLDVSSNQLTNLDVSSNVALTELYVYNNQLKELDVSNNSSLTYFDISYNQLTSLDVSNNTELTILALSENQLTSLNVSNNSALVILDVTYNQLTSLDVSQNPALTYLEISGNSYSEKLYVYKGNTVVVENQVKIPSHLDWNSPVWTISDSNIATMYGNGVVTTLKSGNVDIEGNVSGKYKTTSSVNVVEITSNKYTIDEGNSMIYISNNSDIDRIKENINISHEGVSLNVDLENNKLQVKYNDDVLKEFDIKALDLGNLKELNKMISITDNVSYNNFISNIILSDELSYKIYNGSNVVTSGNITDGMKFKIYYDGKEVDSFDITDEYIFFDEDIKVDDVYLSNIDVGSSVSDIISKIDTSGSITITNNKNEVITGDKLIGTGSKVSIKLSSKTIEYLVIIQGDIDGDGKLALGDIMKLANYLYKDKNSLEEIYLIAADYDDNGIHHLQDIMKIANRIYGGGN